MSPWFVTGFCNRDVALTYSRSGNSINLYFSIKSPGSDREMLDRIMNFFGVGQIYSIRKGPRGADPGAAKLADGVPASALKPFAEGAPVLPAWYYRVCRVKDLRVIIQHFDLFPLYGRKMRNYQIWKQMVVLKEISRHVDMVKMDQLAKQLSALTRSGRRARLEIPSENS
ncbi:MAG: LAGLIDADG family homing endonuclease [Elusimicrobia bacterium]|nr:LAGLIDADG family homing endonuclease [Elusimicrobiota bacterium]